MRSNQLEGGVSVNLKNKKHLKCPINTHGLLNAKFSSVIIFFNALDLENLKKNQQKVNLWAPNLFLEKQMLPPDFHCVDSITTPLCESVMQNNQCKNATDGFILHSKPFFLFICESVTHYCHLVQQLSAENVAQYIQTVRERFRCNGG